MSKRRRLARRKNNPISAPTSVVGQALAGAGLIAAGGVAGFIAGYGVAAVSEKTPGSEAAAWPVLGTAVGLGIAGPIAGLVIASKSSAWRGTGLWAAGIGGAAVLMTIFSTAMKSAQK